MTDRPILFSAPMVGAILREVAAPGAGKTQTRRALKPQPEFSRHHEPVRPEPRGGRRWVFMCRTDFSGYSWATGDFQAPCAAGDRLWVRERLEKANGEATGYPADGTWLPNTPWRWQRSALPSIHMPRWASRLTLIVTDVRVQRLRDISEEDAIAEGVECDSDGWRDYTMPATQCCANARDAFRSLWEHINGPESWQANPWVAAITFRPILANIDSLETTHDR